MALLHIIAHQITRTNPSSPALTKLREDPWQPTGRIDEAFREMKKSALKRSGKEYGRFSDDKASFPFSSWLNEYSNEKMSFTSFTSKAMGHLKSELDKTETPLEAFFVFAHEKLENDEVIHVFLVQHNHAQYIDGDIEISDSLQLDTAGIRLAARINLSDLNSEDPHRVGNAVTLLRWRGEKELTEVFVASVGFAEKIDISAETEAFLNVINDYTKDLPEPVAQQTKSQVVEYCLEQDKSGKPVVMEELSTQLENQAPLDSEQSYTPPPKFASYIADTKPNAKPELIPDKTQLRNFVRISGRNEQLSMSFASSCLGESVVYDAESDSLIIKNIPSSLKSRLIKHVKGGSE